MSFRPDIAARTVRFLGSAAYVTFGVFFLEVARRLVERETYLMAGLVGGFALGVLWLGMLALVTVLHPALSRERFVTFARLAMALALVAAYVGQVADAVLHPGPLWKPLFAVVGLVAYPLFYRYAQRWIR